MKNVGIWGLRSSRITELSGGQLQRAFIARALVSNPSILILDEPTTGVDAEGEEAFYMLMKRINEIYGVTVIMVSHDVYALIDHTDRLMFLNKRLLYDGRPRDLDSSKLLNLLFYHKHSKVMIARLERSLRARSGLKAGARMVR
jgi:zinc transport system ATP-binding protein